MSLVWQRKDIIINEIRNGGREEPDQYRRSSVEFAVDLLRDAGFSSITVTAPTGYSRPLVQGLTQLQNFKGENLC